MTLRLKSASGRITFFVDEEDLQSEQGQEFWRAVLGCERAKETPVSEPSGNGQNTGRG